jgi:hypothetical protein
MARDDSSLEHINVTVKGCLEAQDRCWAKIWKLVGGVLAVFGVLAGLTIASHLILASAQASTLDRTNAVAQTLIQKDAERALQIQSLVEAGKMRESQMAELLAIQKQILEEARKNPGIVK